MEKQIEKTPNWIRKEREVRDIFNHLSKKYKTDVIFPFIERNYFVTFSRLYRMIRQCDKEPVKDPSQVYKEVFKEGFHL
jgi:hypothetical protein